MNPTILALLIAELRRDEGVRYVRYLDSKGIPSTGCGHNLLVRPLPAGWTYPLNDTQVNQLLSTDLAATFSELDARLPWWRQLDDVRIRVIANMAFNMGVADLLEFHDTLAALQAHLYGTAATEMLNSEWAGEVGARATRLAQAMRTGGMPTAAGVA